MESGERFGQREALVKEQARREKPGARVIDRHAEEVGARRVENDGSDVVVIGGEAICEGGAATSAVRNDVLWGDSASGGEVLPGRVRVLSHFLLAGARGSALAVAAIVEGEDVDAEVVQAG